MRMSTTLTRTLALSAALTLALGACSDEGTDDGQTTQEQDGVGVDTEGDDSEVDTEQDNTSEDDSEDGTDTGNTDEADTEDADQDADEDGDDAGAAMTDPACVDFFEGNVTLAQRADDSRAALAAGEVTEPVSWAEVNLLKQRIQSLATGSDTGAEQATLLERINAPFVEASEAVLDSEDQAPTDDELSVGEIDVTDSAASQDEFLAACGG